MSKQLLLFIGLGVAIVAAILFVTVEGNKGQRIRLDGKILKVRTVALDEGHTLVIVDFRVTNPSDFPFVFRDANIVVEDAKGATPEVIPVAKRDMERVFEFQKLAGPKFNDMVAIKDQVKSHATVDRMVGASVALPETEVEARKSLKLRFVEMDGKESELLEKK